MNSNRDSANWWMRRLRTCSPMIIARLGIHGAHMSSRLFTCRECNVARVHTCPPFRSDVDSRRAHGAGFCNITGPGTVVPVVHCLGILARADVGLAGRDNIECQIRRPANSISELVTRQFRKRRKRDSKTTCIHIYEPSSNRREAKSRATASILNELEVQLARRDNKAGETRVEAVANPVSSFPERCWLFDHSPQAYNKNLTIRIGRCPARALVDQSLELIRCG
jgi:hypothetical protein